MARSRPRCYSAGMADSSRLEIHEDIAFERRYWRFQNAGTAAMGLLVAAALLGLLGSGRRAKELHTVHGLSGT